MKYSNNHGHEYVNKALLDHILRLKTPLLFVLLLTFTVSYKTVGTLYPLILCQMQVQGQRVRVERR